jgi:hypothetical protein
LRSREAEENFPMNGTFCVSIDLELAWGIWDRPSREYFERCSKRERRIVRELLNAFARHEIGATWAIVGRLMEHGPTPTPEFGTGDSIWYAPDLIEALVRATPAQEIASHSHAHVYFDALDDGAARADLLAARDTHRRQGLDFQTFVFPRNGVGHLGRLKDTGVKVFRSRDQGWHQAMRDRFGTRVGQAANLMDKALPFTPACVRPRFREGMVELPTSMLLLARNGLRSLIPPASVVAKAKSGLEHACSTGDLFHLWFHPSNFYYDTEIQFAVLGQILECAARLRAQGRLEIVQMQHFARQNQN